jgi:hypothetical protein
MGGECLRRIPHPAQHKSNQNQIKKRANQMTVNDSFFSAYGTTASAVDENPFVAPDNTYKVVVSAAEVTNFKKDDGPDFFSIEISIDGGPHGGKRANFLFRMTPMTAADSDEYETANARTLSNYKACMISLGMKEDMLNLFNPRTMGSKLVGIKGTARVFPSKREGYNNVSNFQRAGVTVESPATETPAAVVGAPATSEPDADELAKLMSGF